MKFLFRLFPVILILLLPAASFGASIGAGPELEVSFLGNSQLQWSVVSGSQKSTYALFGKQNFGLAPGFGFFYIHNRNIFLGATALYRTFEGEFQVPSHGTNQAVTFQEEGLILRLGYIDFFRDATWHFSDFEEPVLPAFPFGHFRIGIMRSDISGSRNFKEFGPAYMGSLGLEVGAVFIPAGHFYFTLSGTVDYSFTVSPYTAHLTGERDEILNNVLMFGMTFQFGFLSEKP